MSTGETGGVGEVRGRLQAGIEELNEAAGPRDAGFANMEIMDGQVHEMQVTLGGIVEFFQSLKERIGPELGAPFQDMKRHYEAAAGHIVPALEGASSVNEHAMNARHGVERAATMGSNMVKNLSNLGADQEKKGSINHTINTLLAAASEMKEVALDLGFPLGDGDRIRSHHANADIYARLYAGEL